MSFKQENPHLIPGFHSVRDALTQGRLRIQEVWISKGKGSGRIREIIRMAQVRKIPIRFKEDSELAALFPGTVHQGVAAKIEEFHYSDLNEVIAASMRRPGHALLVAADHITDEGNLGALVRTAAFFGAHGLILPKDRSAGISATVLKRSSGGYLHLPVVKVVNMGRTLDFLEKKGFWIIGAAGEGRESIYEFDWRRDLVLALGNEERGLTRSVRERCHQVVRITGSARVESLNVSVAGGVILSEIIRQRRLASHEL